MARSYNVAAARKELSTILNLAESGESVLIERNGTRFRLSAEPRVVRAPSKEQEPYVTLLHPSLEAGEWDWHLGPSGAEFVPRDRSEARPKRSSKPVKRK